MDAKLHGELHTIAVNDQIKAKRFEVGDTDFECCSEEKQAIFLYRFGQSVLKFILFVRKAFDGYCFIEHFGLVDSGEGPSKAVVNLMSFTDGIIVEYIDSEGKTAIKDSQLNRFIIDSEVSDR